MFLLFAGFAAVSSVLFAVGTRMRPSDVAAVYASWMIDHGRWMYPPSARSCNMNLLVDDLVEGMRNDLNSTELHAAHKVSQPQTFWPMAELALAVESQPHCSARIWT